MGTPTSRNVAPAGSEYAQTNQTIHQNHQVRWITWSIWIPCEQAILFAQDLSEVTEKLPNVLPGLNNNLDVVVVTETLENLNILRELSIDRSRVNRALKWLVAENELFKDVVINQESSMEESDYVRGQPVIAVKEQEESEIEVHQRGNVCMHVNDVSRIIRAPWHQADETIFPSGSAGMQCKEWCRQTL
ncbi:uncharacterized protein TNCV_3275461 [Trichonephila clavipes]|nr:uncharacterized protein TNCV_3275461 [Trichonephila clavipes]